MPGADPGKEPEGGRYYDPMGCGQRRADSGSDGTEGTDGAADEGR